MKLASLAGIAGLVGLYWLWPGYRAFLDEAWVVLTSDDEARIDAWIGGFGWWGPVVIVLLMIVQIFLIIAPSWLLMVIAVIGYGPWAGALVAGVAVAAASSVGYGLGRLLGRGGLDRLLGEERRAAVERETERYGTWAVVIARVNPLLSNDAVSVVAGIVGMNFWRFLAATLGGIAPLVGAIAWLGRDWTRMREGLLWLSLLSLLGLLAKVWVDHRSRSAGGRGE